jgi:hypothetical protein
MLKLLILLPSFLVSCGQDISDEILHKDNSDERLYRYVLEFKRDANKNGINIDLDRLGSITFGNIKDRYLGECTKYKRDKVTKYKKPYDIVLNENILDIDTWNTHRMIKTIVYHEMGHCALNLDHSENEDSLMYKEINHTETYYKYNWQDLKHDLFNQYLEKE